MNYAYDPKFTVNEDPDFRPTPLMESVAREIRKPYARASQMCSAMAHNIATGKDKPCKEEAGTICTICGEALCCLHVNHINNYLEWTICPDCLCSKVGRMLLPIADTMSKKILDAWRQLRHEEKQSCLPPEKESIPPVICTGNWPSGH